MEKFRETFKQLMNERGVTAATVSKATGIPKSTLSEWLSGRTPKLDDSILKLARFFGVSVERLITGDEPEKEIIQDLLEQAGDGFAEIHQGVYRIKVEKYVGSTRKPNRKK